MWAQTYAHGLHHSSWPCAQGSTHLSVQAHAVALLGTRYMMCAHKFGRSSQRVSAVPLQQALGLLLTLNEIILVTQKYLFIDIGNTEYCSSALVIVSKIVC